jgi:hypothetical protein
VRPASLQFERGLARAELSARGSVSVSQPPGEEAPLAVGYRGNARLTNLHVLDARGESDLLDWQVLELSQIAARLGQGPPEVAVGKIGLSDFYARVIVSDQGRLNLVDLVKRPEGTAADTSTKAEAPRHSGSSHLAGRSGDGGERPAPTTEGGSRAATAMPAATDPVRLGR